MRRRRPVMRLAVGATVGTAAYQAGKSHEQQAAVNDRAQDAYVATQGPPPPTPAAVPADAAGEVERLSRLHDSGALTDAEFSAAKAKALGI